MGFILILLLLLHNHCKGGWGIKYNFIDKFVNFSFDLNTRQYLLSINKCNVISLWNFWMLK